MLPGYPMLELSAVRLFGPPPATVLMAYWASKTWGANSTRAKATETSAGNLGERMITSPPDQKSGPVGPLRCFCYCLCQPSAGRIEAGAPFATTDSPLGGW